MKNKMITMTMAVLLAASLTACADTGTVTETISGEVASQAPSGNAARGTVREPAETDDNASG
ncbi:MAG: hypothetical protein K6F34_08690, partial [Lachnospiraceae bacterium]|nr:hypothetical protein [Lachnospiraceae bacterium]